MRQHVLVIENHEQTRLGLCELFKRAGMPVREAENISGALDGLNDLPSLIVLDLALPDGNGVEVLKALRCAGLHTNVAVISAAVDAPPTAWIPLYHPDAIFGKPFDFADFVDWLNRFDFGSETPKPEQKVLVGRRQPELVA